MNILQSMGRSRIMFYRFSKRQSTTTFSLNLFLSIFGRLQKAPEHILKLQICNR